MVCFFRQKPAYEMLISDWSSDVCASDLPGAVDDQQAPHIDVIVFMRGLLTHLYTRVYFADETANERDPVLLSVPAERRATLIAPREEHGGVSVYRSDIHTQGDKEPGFYDEIGSASDWARGFQKGKIWVVADSRK